jgi:hypothetical protein
VDAYTFKNDVVHCRDDNTDVCATYSGYGPTQGVTCEDDIDSVNNCTGEINFSIVRELSQASNWLVVGTVKISLNELGGCSGVTTHLGACNSCATCSLELPGNATMSADCTNLPG